MEWLLLIVGIQWKEWLIKTLSVRGLNWVCNMVVKKLKKDPVKAAYDVAFKKWDAHFYVKKAYDEYTLDTFEKFSEYVLQRRGLKEDTTEKLFELFEDELAKKPETRGLLDKLRGKKLEIGIEEIIDEVTRLSCTIENQTLLIEQVNDKLSQHNKGNRDVKRPDGYIQRYCTQIVNNKDYLRYILEHGDVKSYKLTDVILGNTECEGNKFILYGDAQTGKTHELKNLAYELKKSGEYIPVLYEVSEYDNLNENLPALDTEHDMGMVLIIDALDEKFDGEERNKLYKEINGYAKGHPYLHIILSCRSNFKGELTLEGFTPLRLNALSREDAFQYLKNRGFENLIDEINDDKYYEFYRVPFYLKAMADYYDEKEVLPQNKAELYDHFITSMLENEEKKRLKMYACMKRKGWQTLQRIAVAFQLMGVKSLPLDDLMDLVDDDKETIDRALRTSLLQTSDGIHYGFAHNSFKEYFVAKYLLKCNNIERVKELSCYHDTAEVRNEWYNTIALLLSMLPKDTVMSDQIMDWIVKYNKELVLYVDDDMFNNAQKHAIFEEILEECKNKNLRFGEFVTSHYEELMKFGYSDETLKYLMKELRAQKEMDNHLVNMLFCLRYLQWGMLEPNVARKLKSLLLNVFGRFIEKQESAYVLFEVLENQSLLNRDTVDAILAIIKDNEQPNVAKQFVSYVLKANLVEEYIDEIIKFGVYIHDYGGNGCTNIVSRDKLLYAYQKAERWDNIKKVIKQLARDIKNHLYSEVSDSRDYHRTMEILLDKAACQTKSIPEIPDFIFDILIDIAEERQGKKQERTDVFVKFFKATGTTDYYFEQSLNRLKEILTAQDETKNFSEQWDLAGAYAYCVALLLDDEKLEYVDSQNQQNSLEGYNLLSWINQYATDEMRNEIQIIQKNRYPNYWRDPQKLSKWDLLHQRDYDDLMDYETYKSKVLKLLEEKAPKNKDDIRALRKIKIEFCDDEIDEVNQYVIQILHEHTGGDELLNVDGVKKFVLDERKCRYMMVEATMNILHSSYSKVVVTKKQREIFTRATIEWLHELATSSYDYWYHSKNAAISALLHREVIIDKALLLQLLPYSSFSIHLKDDSISGKTFRLFDLIVEEFSDQKYVLLNALKECFDKRNVLAEPNLKIWGVYLVRNNITSEYQRVIGWMQVMRDNDPAYSIIKALVENPVTKQKVMSKEVMKQCDAIKRLYIYELLSNDNELDDFVRKGVEKEFGRINADRKYLALRILLAKGSLVGLKYLAKHTEMLNYSVPMHYQTLEALPWLMKIYCAELDRYHRSDYMFVLNAIEEIAMVSEDNWLVVKAEMEKKIKWRRKKFIHLNWYIENWDMKIKSKNTPVMDMNEVKRILNEGWV